MIRVLFVGDGPRDATCLPAIVRKLIATEPSSLFRAWREIRVGGYERKLLFAIRVARVDKLDGVVAVVDSDRARPRERLGKLRAGRDRDRTLAAPLPTALGEARPHVEAWLLDDPVAAREGLRLSPDVEVPTVRQVKNEPKQVIAELVAKATAAKGETTFLPALESIARRVDPARCAHAKETGFGEFVEDVRHEFRPFLATSVE